MWIHAFPESWRRIYIVAVCLLFIQTVSAIRCSICGQSNLTAPGECTSQFQYDCVSNPANRGQQFNQQGLPDAERRQQPKILCRTTRTKLNENLFAVVKECVTENEHLNRYPEGKAFGCETVRSNSTFPTTYCVCDQDLCNSRSLDEQLKQPQPSLSQTEDTQSPASPIGGLQAPRPQPAAQRQSLAATEQYHIVPNASQTMQISHNPQALNSGSSGQAALPQQPQLPDEASIANPLPWDGTVASNPSFVQELPPNEHAPRNDAHTIDQAERRPGASLAAGSTPLFVQLNTERVEFLPESSTPIDRFASNLPSNKAPPQQGRLSCMVCNEGNTSVSQDCQVQNPIDCANLFNPVSKLFCFSKAITQNAGPSTIEKRCASEEQLIQELGLPAIQPSCFSGQDGHARTDYCICDTDKCNQLPIANQANLYPPLTITDLAGPPNTNPINASHSQGGQSRKCYVCGESDQAHPSDCSQQYEYDCGRQYQQNPTVLCLTRLTKVASGRYNIEKRCITPAEHQLQYPGNEVTLDGCNDAWNGYVQYCVCQGDFCNGQNITTQQQSHQWAPRPSPAEDGAAETENESEQEDRTVQPVSSPRQQSQPPQTPPLPNGLLSPPSTRLPLPHSARHQPSTADQSTAPADNGVSQPTITTEASPMPPSHRPPPHPHNTTGDGTTKRGPPTPRRGSPRTADDDILSDKSSAHSPGFLTCVALTIVTVVTIQSL